MMSFRLNYLNHSLIRTIVFFNLLCKFSSTWPDPRAAGRSLLNLFTPESKLFIFKGPGNTKQLLLSPKANQKMIARASRFPGWLFYFRKESRGHRRACCSRLTVICVEGPLMAALPGNGSHGSQNLKPQDKNTLLGVPQNKQCRSSYSQHYNHNAEFRPPMLVSSCFEGSLLLLELLFSSYNSNSVSWCPSFTLELLIKDSHSSHPPLTPKHFLRSPPLSLSTRGTMESAHAGELTTEQDRNSSVSQPKKISPTQSHENTI